MEPTVSLLYLALLLALIALVARALAPHAPAPAVGSAPPATREGSGAGQRAYALARMRGEIASAARDGRSVTLIACEVEHDDADGAADGDEAAARRRAVVAAVVAALRGGDVIAGVDGGTFAVLLPGADASQSAAVVARMRRGIAQAGVAGGVSMSRVTDSLGAHSFGGDGSVDLDRLLAHAVAGLPRARAWGGHVVVENPPVPTSGNRPIPMPARSPAHRRLGFP